MRKSNSEPLLYVELDDQDGYDVREVLGNRIQLEFCHPSRLSRLFLEIPADTAAQLARAILQKLGTGL